jgi:hypothetical protein
MLLAPRQQTDVIYTSNEGFSAIHEGIQCFKSAIKPPLPSLEETIRAKRDEGWQQIIYAVPRSLSPHAVGTGLMDYSLSWVWTNTQTAKQSCQGMVKRHLIFKNVTKVKSKMSVICQDCDLHMQPVSYISLKHSKRLASWQYSGSNHNLTKDF